MKPAAKLSLQPIRNSPVPGSARNSSDLTPLPELIEHGDAALEQCPAIDRGLNSMCSAVEQAQTHGVLDLSNRLGHRGLRNGEIGGRFSHAAGFRDGKQNVQVA
jgi:hypothetical protein